MKDLAVARLGHCGWSQESSVAPTLGPLDTLKGSMDTVVRGISGCRLLCLQVLLGCHHSGRTPLLLGAGLGHGDDVGAYTSE